MNTAKERIEAVRTALKLLADREAFIEDAAVYYYRGEDVCVAAGSDEGRAVESALTVLMANAPALLADIDRLRAELAAVRAAAVEACDLAASAIRNAPPADSADPGDEASSAAGLQRVAEIRARIGGGP